MGPAFPGLSLHVQPQCCLVPFFYQNRMHKRCVASHARMLLMLHPESIKFRQLQPGANTAYVLGSFFRTDRRFIDSTIFPSEMPAIWAIQGQRVVLDAPGNPSIRQMSFEVTRLPNWGWH